MGRIYRSTDRRLPSEIRRQFDAIVGRDLLRPFSFQGEVKAFDPAREMVVEGIANLAEPDRWGEVIDPKAWRLDQYKSNPLILREHDRRLPIGTCLEVAARLDGLYYRAQIGDPARAPLTVCQQETRSLLAQGILRTNSVGFLPHVIEWDEDDDVLRYTDVELLEISIVAIPMQQDSVITDVKSWRQIRMAKSQSQAQAGDDSLIDALTRHGETLADVKALVEKLAAGGDQKAAALEARIKELEAKLDAKSKAFDTLEAKAKSLVDNLRARGLIKPAA